MAGVEIHAARPKTAPSVLSSLLASRNPLNAARTTVAPWLRATEERVPSVIPGLLAGAIEKAPIFAPTVGEAVGKTGEAVVGPELLAAMKMMERDPTQRTDLMGGMLSSPLAYPMAAMNVYHGSPYFFKTFDGKRLGSGEGNAAYGDGIYLAENKAVGNSYATDMVAQKAVNEGRLSLTRGDVDFGAIYAQVPAHLVPKTRRGFLDDVNHLIAEGILDKRNKADFMAIADDILATRRDGYLYKVNLPDEVVPKLLDYDKPFKQQAKHVQEALSDIAKEYGREIPVDGPIGPWVVNGTFEPDLLKRGIPGLRYLDGDSRWRGIGTSNFVIFDDSLLSINGVLHTK